MYKVNLIMPGFTDLLNEILDWLPESTHDDVRSKWPPVKASLLPDDDSD